MSNSNEKHTKVGNPYKMNMTNGAGFNFNKRSGGGGI